MKKTIELLLLRIYPYSSVAKTMKKMDHCKLTTNQNINSLQKQAEKERPRVHVLEVAPKPQI